MKNENDIRELHVGLFIINFFLLIIVIILTIFGYGFTCFFWVLLVLILLNSLFFWHRRRIIRFKQEKVIKRTSSNYQVVNLPKVYDFYCPRCLYQTNEDIELCPNCKIGKITPTTRNPDFQDK
jgi:hypothetical protein